MTEATPLASEQITQEDREAAVRLLYLSWKQQHGNVVYGWMRDEEGATLAGKRDQHWAVQYAAQERHRIAALSASPAPSGQGVSGDGQAIADVVGERTRQRETEGWSSEHDDEHRDGSLAIAAATYALAAVEPAVERAVMDQFGDASATPYRIHSMWPWDLAWLKPKSRRTDLVRAGALIIAEIERLDRMENSHD